MNPTAGVPREEATATDFIMVRAALVARLGGANEALVWTRIQYRCDVVSQQTHQDEQGRVWWPVSRETLATETGLSPDKVRRALEALISAEFLDSTEHRLGGNYDRTKSYAPAWSVRPVDGAPAPNESGAGAQSDRAPAPRLTSTKTSKTKSQDVLPGTAVEKVSEGGVAARDLCQRLSDLIVENGSKPPTITKRWLDAARLLVDRDGRSPAQVRNMIDWCQADGFWRSNILSMPKLRENYDQMRLKAMQGAAPKSTVDKGRAVDEELRRRAAAGQESKPWTPSQLTS